MFAGVTSELSNLCNLGPHTINFDIPRENKHEMIRLTLRGYLQILLHFRLKIINKTLNPTAFKRVDKIAKPLVSGSTKCCQTYRAIQFQSRSASTLLTPTFVPAAGIQLNTTLGLSHRLALLNITASPANNVQQVRTVTKFSLKKGKRKTVKAVLRRFKRLDWGGWIRTRTGRHKRIWRKSPNLQRRLRQHVLVNATQSWLLDKMVTPYWRRPKYYVDDPYRPYHQRDYYFKTRRTPVKY